MAPPETLPLSASQSGRAASRIGDCLLLWLIQTVSSQRVASFFILPSFLHLLHGGRLLSISWCKVTTLCSSPGPQRPLPVGTQQGFPGRSSSRLIITTWVCQCPGDCCTTSASCNWHFSITGWCVKSSHRRPEPSSSSKIVLFVKFTHPQRVT